MTRDRDGLHYDRDASEFTRAEVLKACGLAGELVRQYEHRSPTSQYATLGENDALFNLHFELSRMFKRIAPAHRRTV